MVLFFLCCSVAALVAAIFIGRRTARQVAERHADELVAADRAGHDRGWSAMLRQHRDLEKEVLRLEDSLAKVREEYNKWRDFATRGAICSACSQKGALVPLGDSALAAYGREGLCPFHEREVGAAVSSRYHS